MDKTIYDNISLLAEYDFQIGGAQRMLSVVAKRMNKPVYVLANRKNPSKIWDVTPILEIPPTKIVFSLVVDSYKLQIIPKKKQIKFCHSGTSLENFVDNPMAKDIPWLTHRERVYKFWKRKGFNIDLIPKGYIPYDKTLIEDTPAKNDQGVFTSRICSAKSPELAIKLFQNLGIPLYFAGNCEFRDYVESLNKNVSENIIFVQPDEGTGVRLETRDEILRKSKILVHCSFGGMHDYLEYSILDGLIFNCVPLCITSEPEQFLIVEEKRIGKVVKNVEEAKKALFYLLNNYESYVKRSQEFINLFIKDQGVLWQRWESKLEEVCSKLI